ncbi:MAG TPA: alpha-galactosidase [Candidatus Hydrogenedentes bacterium]|nr:alpha-galactosidase [Candidatus Hydrogenedentota bacterium]
MWLGVVAFWMTTVEGAVVTNDMLSLSLGSHEGAPVIESASWRKSNEIVFTADPPCAADAWIPRELMPETPVSGADWTLSETPVFLCAETHRSLAGGLMMTWHVSLAKHAPLIEMRIGVKNDGVEPRSVPWFPVWTARWTLKGIERVRGWRALSFSRENHAVVRPMRIEWGSCIHSSDEIENGMNPYWVVKTATSHVYFALAWCGGWRARLDAAPDTFAFDVHLPPDETQLTLAPGETMDGPELSVTFVPEEDESLARALWMTWRAALARAEYGISPPIFPFTYNHWYAARFGVDAAFLERQLESMSPYDFDAFIVDAGWYEAVGRWVPDPVKFPDGSFVRIMRALEEADVMPGLWSCPQFVKADRSALPPEVDSPGMHRKFIDGWLLDLAGCDFTSRLSGHVAMLRTDYHAGWWKYDQDFFTAHTRAGRMRNVRAFQNALKSVRGNHPDLVIENCQSGGRMINEFTVRLAQSQWLCDGGHTGGALARDSISIAINAMDFIFPWACNRWTNNPDRVDADDKAFFRYWCRAAMAGTWGIAADLGAIDGARQAMLVEAREEYRRINAFKRDCLYDLFPPEHGDAPAGVVFYLADGTGAAVMLFRREKGDAVEQVFPLRFLDARRNFMVEDADTAARHAYRGKTLRNKGLPLPWTPDRMSAVLFVRTRDDGA